MKTSKVFITSLLNDALALVLIVVGWLFVSLFYPSYIIPSPASVWSAGSSMLTSDFGMHFSTTIYRVLIAFLASFIFGTILGILLSISGLQKPANSLMVALQVIPGTILGVVFLLVFGIGSATPIFLAVFLTLPSLVINTINGLSVRSRSLEAYLSTLNASRWQVIRYSYLPSLVPVLQSNVSLGIGLIMKVVILGEFIGSQNGLGYLLNNARILFNMKEVFFYLLVLILFSLLCQAVNSLIFSLPFRKFFYSE